MRRSELTIQQLDAEPSIIVVGRVSVYNATLEKAIHCIFLLLAGVVSLLPEVLWRLFLNLDHVPILIAFVTCVAVGMMTFGFSGIMYFLYQYIYPIIRHGNSTRYGYYLVRIAEGTPISTFQRYSHNIVWLTRDGMIMRAVKPRRRPQEGLK